MKLSRELKTAIIILGGILLFILGFSFLKSTSLFDDSKTFYAVYEEVSGLTPGTAVDINGLSVGTIKKIEFLGNKGDLVVTFMVTKDFPISKSSKAEIYDTGIIGGKALRIVPVFDGSGAAVSGDTLTAMVNPGITELVTRRLTPLQEKLEGLITSADSVLIGIDNVLHEGSRASIEASIAELETGIRNVNMITGDLSGLLRENKGKLSSAIDNVNNMSGNLNELSEELAQIEFGQVVNQLSGTADRIDNLILSIQQGEGSLGALLKDETLYNNLTGASEEMKMLLEDMRLNPKRYVHFSVFGKKDKGYQSPQN